MRLHTISKIYNGMKVTFKTIRMKDINIRRKIFLAYALPHYLWLFATWFFYSDRQRERIEHIFCHGLKIVYNLHQWDDITTLLLARDKSLRDYLFTYWRRLVLHFLNSPEALSFQLTWNAYPTITSNKTWYKSMGFRKNSILPNRLIDQVKHCLMDWMDFDAVHVKQYEYFKKLTNIINSFIYKYYLLPP